jgi:hypothetical protein
MSLSAAEVGDVDEGGYLPSAALERYRQRKVITPVANASPPQYRPILRRYYPPGVELPQAFFDMDMTALKPIDHSFSWAGESVAITTRHGQAFLGTVRLSMKRKTLRAGGARRPQQRSFPIDEGRLALLKLWYRDEAMAAIWQHEWERLTVWEASGGWVLHWAVTTHIRLHYAVHNAVCIFRLAADPSFEYYLSVDDKPLEGTTYLQLYEMTPAQADLAMQQYETCSWVAVLRSDQTSKALKDVRRLGRLGQRFVKGAKIMMKRT